MNDPQHQYVQAVYLPERQLGDSLAAASRLIIQHNAINVIETT
jgi:hypothetical protein